MCEMRVFHAQCVRVESTGVYVCVCVTGSPLKANPHFLSKVCPPNNR